jgi:hypothetical protein
VLTVAQGAARLARIIGINVDELIGDVASVIAQTCQRALNWDELAQYNKPAAGAHEDKEQQEKDEVAEKIGKLITAHEESLACTPVSPASSSSSFSAESNERTLDGTALVKLWAEIDPEQDCRNASAKGIADLFRTMVRDVRTNKMKAYFYCREHRDFYNAHKSAGPLDRDVWLTQSLSISQAATAQCRIPAVLAMRAENERARPIVDAMQSRIQRAAIDLAACMEAERDECVKRHLASAAEATRAPNAAALRADATRASIVTEERQRKLVFHMVKGKGKHWVVDGQSMRQSEDKEAAKRCDQCGEEFGLFSFSFTSSVKKCKMCGEFRCKACAPVVEPQPRMNTMAFIDGRWVNQASEEIEVRACKPPARHGEAPVCWARARAATFERLLPPAK